MNLANKLGLMLFIIGTVYSVTMEDDIGMAVCFILMFFGSLMFTLKLGE